MSGEHGGDGAPSGDGPIPGAADGTGVPAAADEAVAAAAATLLEALASEAGRPPPEGALQAAASRLQDAAAEGEETAAWLRRAAGLDEDLRTPGGDRPVGGDLVLLLAAGTVEPLADPGLAADDEAALRALVPSDWLGMVLGAVRAGPGAAADPGAMVRRIEDCPEAAGPALEPGDAAVVAHALEVLLPAWRLLGIVDAQHRLTELGAWLLPRAVCLVWGGDLDAAEPPEGGEQRT